MCGGSKSFIVSHFYLKLGLQNQFPPYTVCTNMVVSQNHSRRSPELKAIGLNGNTIIKKKRKQGNEKLLGCVRER